MSTVESASSSRARHTRREILAAGVALLSEEGVRGITVEGVSRRSGIAKTTIYRYWPTREQLVIAVIDEVKFDLPTPDSGDTRRDIAVVLKELWSLVRQPSHRVTIASMIEALVDDSVRDAFHVRFLIDSGRPVSDLLSRGVRTGEFDAGLDVEYAFRMLTGPVMAGAVILGAPVDDAFVDHLIEQVLGTEGR